MTDLNRIERALEQAFLLGEENRVVYRIVARDGSLYPVTYAELARAIRGDVVGCALDEDVARARATCDISFESCKSCSHSRVARAVPSRTPNPSRVARLASVGGFFFESCKDAYRLRALSVLA